MRCGTFLEGKMENKVKKDAGSDRREFLKRSAVSVAAAGAGKLPGTEAGCGSSGFDSVGRPMAGTTV